MPAKPTPWWMARASPVFAGKPAPTGIAPAFEMSRTVAPTGSVQVSSLGHNRPSSDHPVSPSRRVCGLRAAPAPSSAQHRAARHRSTATAPCGYASGAASGPSAPTLRRVEHLGLLLSFQFLGQQLQAHIAHAPITAPSPFSRYRRQSMREGDTGNTDPKQPYYSHTALAGGRLNAVFSRQLYRSLPAGSPGVCLDPLPQPRRTARCPHRAGPVSPRPAPAVGTRPERGARGQPEHRAAGLPHARRQRHGLAQAQVRLFRQRPPPAASAACSQPPGPAPCGHLAMGTGTRAGAQHPARTWCNSAAACPISTAPPSSLCCAASPS